MWTVTGQKLPNLLSSSPFPQRLYGTCDYIYLYNGDKCTIGEHVLARHHRPHEEIHPNPTFIARIVEVIQQVGSPAHMQGWGDGILLQMVDLSGPNTKYQMPQLLLKNEW